jgi:nicotinamide-nucleotide amidase
MSNDQLSSMAAAVAEQLKARGETISVAETSAGGLISAALLVVPGASAYFVGGGVLYNHDARTGLLGVPKAAMEGIRSSSEPYAQLLAASIRERLSTTWGLAETGAAGPTGNRYGDDAGHTCIAITGPYSEARTLETESNDREANMWAFAAVAFELLATALADSG